MASAKKIMELEKKLENHQERISKLEELFRSKPESIEKGIAIKEFFLSKNPKNGVQKTLLVGYYLEKYENMPYFNIKDLEEGFRKAKAIIPSNINHKAYLNVRKGHMMESKEKKEGLKTWNLTNIGERFVENGFKEV